MYKIVFGLILIISMIKFTFGQSELVVFYDAKDKRQRSFFESDSINHRMIDQFGRWKLVDVNEQGAPKGVGITPQIVCSNFKGLSIYVGRYTNIGRMKNFYRTAKVVVQADQKENIEHAIVHHDHRSNLLLKLKLTAPSGKTEGKQLDMTEEWKDKLYKSIGKKSKYFSYQDTFSYRSKLDRKFYLDIHTYFSEDKAYISYAIFSQYNCIDPVYDNFKESFEWTDLKQMDKAYLEVFELAEKQMETVMKENDEGYGFQFIDDKVQEKQWSDFIDSVEIDHHVRDHQDITLDLDRTWTVKGQVRPDIPLISFHFLEPVDNYAGELKTLEGQFKIHKDTVNALFVAPLTDLTMGDDFLDQEVHHSKLKIVEYPEVKVWIRDAYLNNPIEWSIRSSFEWMIDLELKGIKISLPIQGFVEPILNEEGKVNLVLDVKFQLANLYDHFHIKGPDGPKESAETIQFYVHLILE